MRKMPLLIDRSIRQTDLLSRMGSAAGFGAIQVLIWEPSMPTPTEFLLLWATRCGGRCSITFVNTGTNTVTITSDHRCVFLGWDHPYRACDFRPCLPYISPAATVTSTNPPLFPPYVFVFPLHVTNQEALLFER